MWPCLFCTRQIENAYPAHHGNFWVGDLLGPGWGGWNGKTGIIEKLKWAWEAVFGIRIWSNFPDRSVSLGTPYGCIGARTEGFGNVGFLSEMVGCEFFVFGKFGLGLMGLVGDGDWAEPVRNGPDFWYGPIWMPLGPLGALIWAPRPIFPISPISRFLPWVISRKVSVVGPVGSLCLSYKSDRAICQLGRIRKLEHCQPVPRIWVPPQKL